MKDCKAIKVLDRMGKAGTKAIYKAEKQSGLPKKFKVPNIKL